MTEGHRSPDHGKDLALAAATVTVIVPGLLLYVSGGIGALLVHHRWPHMSVSQAVGLTFNVAHHLGDPRLGWPKAARALVPGPVLVYFVLALELGLVLGTAIWTWRRLRGPRRAGFAHEKDLRAHMSRRSVLRRAAQVRPSMREGRNDPRQLGVRLGRAVGTGAELWASLEDSFLVLGPPRSNKTASIVIPGVVEAPGAVIVTSIRPEILRHTAQTREGPTYVFDPQGSSRWPTRLRWSPVVGCEDSLVAIRRARGFAEGAGDSRPSSGDAEFFNRSATAVIRCYLHAAALADATMAEVLSWSARPQDPQPLRILSNHPRAVPGWSRMLSSGVAWDPRTRDGIWATVARAFDCFADPRVLDACSPQVGEAFSAKEFFDSKGTLHVIGSPETQLSLAPLISAFVEDLVEQALEIAATSTSGRLDPPLSLWLDEAANIAPLDALPQLLSAGGGSGICTTVVLQSLAQARARWGPDKADAIWDASTVRVVFGGLGHAEDLSRISLLAGDVDEPVTSQTTGAGGASWSSSLRQRPALALKELRTLPEGHAVVLHRRTPPVEVALEPWWRRPMAQKVKQSLATCDRYLGRSK